MYEKLVEYEPSTQPAETADSLRVILTAEDLGPLALQQVELHTSQIEESLTIKEQLHLKMVSAGMTADEVAKELWVTKSTVKYHRDNIYKKYNVDSAPAAVCQGIIKRQLDVRFTQSDYESLTPREMDVAELAAIGWKNNTIAENLSMAAETVKIHLSYIFQKLDAKNRAHLPRKLIEAGLWALGQDDFGNCLIVRSPDSKLNQKYAQIELINLESASWGKCMSETAAARSVSLNTVKAQRIIILEKSESKTLSGVIFDCLVAGELKFEREEYPVSPGLSPRETEVAALICAGRSTEEIAKELNTSRSTIRDHVRSTKTKLGAKTRPHIPRRLFETGVY